MPSSPTCGRASTGADGPAVTRPRMVEGATAVTCGAAGASATHVATPTTVTLRRPATKRPTTPSRPPNFSKPEQPLRGHKASPALAPTCAPVVLPRGLRDEIALEVIAGTRFDACDGLFPGLHHP